MKIKLNKCKSCRKFPFVEFFTEDFKKKIKIFCEHGYFESESREHAAFNWNRHNDSVSQTN